jgi:hypothetical protein
MMHFGVWGDAVHSSSSIRTFLQVSDAIKTPGWRQDSQVAECPKWGFPGMGVSRNGSFIIIYNGKSY